MKKKARLSAQTQDTKKKIGVTLDDKTYSKVFEIAHRLKSSESHACRLIITTYINDFHKLIIIDGKLPPVQS